MTPCIPSKPRTECAQCARYRPDMPSDAQRRPLTVCIDATCIRRAAPCVFFVAMQRL